MSYRLIEGRRVAQFGFARTELRRELVDAILRGDKTATASLRVEYAPHTDEPLPAPGEVMVVVDYDDVPVALIETTEVRVVRAADVDVAFARDEGEGFETVAAWRAAHERFWSRHAISDDTLVVAERFRLLGPV